MARRAHRAQVCGVGRGAQAPCTLELETCASLRRTCASLHRTCALSGRGPSLSAHVAPPAWPPKPHGGGVRRRCVPQPVALTGALAARGHGRAPRHVPTRGARPACALMVLHHRGSDRLKKKRQQKRQRTHADRQSTSPKPPTWSTWSAGCNLGSGTPASDSRQPRMVNGMTGRRRRSALRQKTRSNAGWRDRAPRPEGG